MHSLSGTLFRHLHEFRVWWIEHRDQLQAIVGEVAGEPDIFNEPNLLQDINIWDGMTVMDKARTLMYMRMVREVWDSILRDHEDAWESEMSLRRQMQILDASRDFINDVFLTPEEREAKWAEQAREEQEEVPRLDDVHVPMPPDFNISDIIGDDFDPEAEDDDGEEEDGEAG
jgi:hypothetical protein